MTLQEGNQTMGYIDNDGDYIIDTVEELKEFAANTPCVQYSSDAWEMVTVLGGNELVKLVFSTTCEHTRSDAT